MLEFGVKMTKIKEHVQISGFGEDSAYIGYGSWVDCPAIIYDNKLSLTFLHQIHSGNTNTIQFTDRQLEALYDALKRRFEND